VHIASGAIEAIRQSIDTEKYSQAVIVSETTVAPLYAERVADALRGKAGWGVRVAKPFSAGEQNKTLATASSVLDDVLGGDPPVDRKTLIVALGGGVTGDLAGFVAAVALRGLPFVQVPTTLLAMVDSSVGGKTGVDHDAGKNLIGAFHQPQAVVADVETLRTLPARELSNGLAESVKHGVIRDPSLLAFLEANAETLTSPDFDADVMVELVARNVAIKADVVAADEREAGVRAYLNAGHTVGHAVETFVGYESIRHGEAIALGLVAELQLSVNRGLLAAADAQRVVSLMSRLNLPITQPGLDVPALCSLMQRDKKTLRGQLRISVPTALGEMTILDDLRVEELQAAIETLAG
jgi:3-dehydroquinate synthase